MERKKAICELLENCMSFGEENFQTVKDCAFQ